MENSEIKQMKKMNHQMKEDQKVYSKPKFVFEDEETKEICSKEIGINHSI